MYKKDRKKIYESKGLSFDSKTVDQAVKKSRMLRLEVMSWLILLVIVIGMFFSIPPLIKSFFQFTFGKPFLAQQKAVQRANKTADTASGVEGTSINNIPFNSFQSMINRTTKSFDEVDIEIPKLYVSSPIFNMGRYGDSLQDIWLDSINEDRLSKEFGKYKIYYNKNLVNDNGVQYTSKSATSNQISEMKKQIITELQINPKYSKFKFKKWYIPKSGSSTILATIVNGKYRFEAIMEVKDFKPNLIFGVTSKKITAIFIDEPKIQLVKDSLEVK